MEAQREHDRYAAYLDEQDSEKLPNAFDLGWRRNLLHVFGESPLLWFLPICNSTGDGWMWEVSPKWTNARTEITNERLRWQAQQQQQQQSQHTPNFEPPANRDWKWTPGGFVDRPRPAPPRVSGNNADGMGSEMQPIGRRKVSGDANEYDTSSDEDAPKRGGSRPLSGTAASTSNWNDIPDDFLSAKGKGNERIRSASRGRRKGD
jgi:palmitoyltransferase